MKIAYFTDTYEPQVNGVVTSIKLFAKNLRKNGHEVYIFCPSCSKKDKYTYPISSKEFKNYPEYRVGLPNFNVLKKIKEIEPDLIHVHSPFTLGTLGLSIGKILNIPVIATYHTLLKEYFDYIGPTRFFKSKIAEDYTKWFFSRSLFVIAPSESTKKLLKNYGIKNQIKVFPTLLDFDIKQNKNKKPFILHVGRLCKEKRIETILKALKKVHKKLKLKLVITSDGPYKKRLLELCKELKISDKVVFTGYLDKKDLLKLYSTSSLFVSASDTETQGIVILEAMANGCPVIARNALGFKDVIDDRKNGLLFNTEDELVEKILFLFKNKKIRNKLIKNAYKTAKQYNMKNNKIEDLYYEALTENRVSKLQNKILYKFYLIFSFLEFYLIKKLKININSRFLRLHLALFKLTLFLERFKDFS